MTEPLDERAPLDDATTKRIMIRLGLAVAAWCIPVFVLLQWRGLGGLRYGWALCAAAIGVGAAVIAWLAGRRLPSPFTYPAAAAVIGMVLALQLSSTAPLGEDRLVEYVDGLRLEGSLVSQKSSGSTTCNPKCPTLERAYELAYTRTNVGQTITESALFASGFAVEDLAREVDRFTIANDDISVEARFSRSEKGVRAVLTFTSKRR